MGVNIKNKTFMDIANVISTCMIKKYLGSRVHYLGQNAYGRIGIFPILFYLPKVYR